MSFFFFCVYGGFLNRILPSKKKMMLGFSNKEPWKLSSYSLFDEKQDRMVWLKSRYEKLCSYVKELKSRDVTGCVEGDGVMELYFAYVRLYNSLHRSSDYRKNFSIEKDESDFVELMRFLDAQPCRNLPALVKADIYRRVGNMASVTALLDECSADIPEHGLYAYIRQLCISGVTAPIVPGDILTMRDSVSDSPIVVRYFYNDNIL